MKNYLWKYDIKPHIFKAAALVLLILTVQAAFNLHLSISQEQITQNLARKIKQEISIGSIKYRLPNSILVRDIIVSQDGPAAKKQIFTIKLVRIKFSLVRFISKGEFVVTEIYLTKPQLNYAAFACFLKENIKEIIRMIKYWAQEQDIYLNIREISVAFAQQHNLTISSAADFSLEITGEDVKSSGTVRLDGLSAKFVALRYNFQGILTEKGVFIKDLEFKMADFYAQLWGGLEGDLLKLDGFSLIKDATEFYILDIDCLARFTLPKIEIVNLNFGLRQDPFFVKGNIDFSERSSTSFTFSSSAMKIGIRNSAFTFTERGHLKLSFQELDLSYVAGNKLYGLPFKDFDILFNLSNQKRVLVECNSRIYDGISRGQGSFDLSKLPSSYNFSVIAEGVSVNKLDFLSSYFANVYGVLEGRIRGTSMSLYPDLNGEISISGGRLENFDFLDWFAEFFKIPSLKSVNFDKLSINFLVNRKFVNLNKIALRSKEVDLDGHFSLEENGLGRGELSIALSRRLLGDSAKFRPLLGLVDAEQSSLSFDFQFSGMIEAMNIKWKESEFKKRLAELLPDSMEMDLERKVEDILTSKIEAQP